MVQCGVLVRVRGSINVIFSSHRIYRMPSHMYHLVEVFPFSFIGQWVDDLPGNVDWNELPLLIQLIA